VVLADGVFDPIHWGHVRYLAAASGLGDVYVRVAPDDEILRKGRFVYQTREERVKTLASLRVVTGVLSEEMSLASTIRELEPVYLVKGEDWRGRLPSDVLLACKEAGTQILFLDTQEKSSRERLTQ
jgi:cytidyltransferase-like protein